MIYLLYISFENHKIDNHDVVVSKLQLSFSLFHILCFQDLLGKMRSSLLCKINDETSLHRVLVESYDTLEVFLIEAARTAVDTIARSS